MLKKFKLLVTKSQKPKADYIKTIFTKSKCYQDGKYVQSGCKIGPAIIQCRESISDISWKTFLGNFN